MKHAAPLVFLLACNQVSDLTEDVLSEVPPEAVPDSVRKALPVTEVDAYVTAGFDSPARTCHFSRMGTAGGESCSLYRLRLDLSENRAGDVRTIIRSDEAGVYEPSISPDGTRVAFVRASRDGGQVQVRSLTGAVTSFGVTVSDADARAPQFPTWLDTSTVLYSTSDPAARCVTPDGRCTSIDRWGDIFRVPATGGASTVFRGSGETGGASFKDARISSDGRFVTSHGDTASGSIARDATCPAAGALSCSDLPTSDKPVPQVSSTEDGRTWWFNLENDEPGRHFPLAGCAHTHLNPSGDTILCTEQKTPELNAPPLTNRIYGVPFDPAAEPGGTTVKVKPLFTHKAPEDLWPLAPGQECIKMLHKYAEFCGDDDHVVTTVSCECDTESCVGQGSATASKVMYSRIYLIDITAPESPVYTDLTGAIERAVGVERGGLHSFTATCSTALSDAGSDATAPAPIPDDATPRERARGQPQKRPEPGAGNNGGGARPRPGAAPGGGAPGSRR